MIEVQEIKQFPRNALGMLADTAKEEFVRLGLSAYGAVSASNKAWVVSLDGTPILFAGLFGGGGLLSGKPEVWLMPCKAFAANLRDAVRAVKVLRDQLPPCSARVSTHFPAGLKFAEFFGFKVIREDDDMFYLEG